MGDRGPIIMLLQNFHHGWTLVSVSFNLYKFNQVRSHCYSQAGESTCITTQVCEPVFPVRKLQHEI